MPRGPASFKQCDIVRAVKAARAAGLEVERTEIGPDGRITLVHKTDAAVDSAEALLEAFKAKRNARQA